MITPYAEVVKRQSKLGQNYPDPNGAKMLDAFDRAGAANLDMVDAEKEGIPRQQRYVTAALQKIATTMRHIQLRSTVQLGGEQELAVAACMHPLLSPDTEGDVGEVTNDTINHYMRFWPLKNVRQADKRLFNGAGELLDASFKIAVSEKAIILAENDDDAGDIAVEGVRARLAKDIALAKQVMWVADGREAEYARLCSPAPKLP